MGLGRKLRRHKAKAARAIGYGTCSDPKCHARATSRHECQTCERLGLEVFEVTPCSAHYESELQRIKRHAMVGHPVNLLRAAIAGLKGEL